MKIIVLGSSADKGFFHRAGKDRRTRSSICLEKDGKFIVVDAGPDFWRQIKREKIKPNLIILTHSHPDHTKGLYLRKVNLPVYATKETWQDLKRCKIPDKLRFKLEIGEIIKLVGFEIVIFPVQHSPRIKTFGLKIDRLTYIPDLTKIPEESGKIVQKSRILVLDGSILDRDLNIHASIKKQIGWVKNFPAKKIYFTHIGRNTAKRPHQELVRYLKTLDSRCDVFYDGLRFEIK